MIEEVINNEVKNVGVNDININVTEKSVMHREVSVISASTLDEAMLSAYLANTLINTSDDVITNVLMITPVFSTLSFLDVLDVLNEDNKIEILGSGVYDYKLTSLFNSIHESVSVDSIIEDIDEVMVVIDKNESINFTLKEFKRKIDMTKNLFINDFNGKVDVSNKYFDFESDFSSSYLDSINIIMVQNHSTIKELSDVTNEWSDAHSLVVKTFINMTNVTTPMSSTYITTLMGKMYEIKNNIEKKFIIRRVI